MACVSGVVSLAALLVIDANAPVPSKVSESASFSIVTADPTAASADHTAVTATAGTTTHTTATVISNPCIAFTGTSTS